MEFQKFLPASMLANLVVSFISLALAVHVCAAACVLLVERKEGRKKWKGMMQKRRRRRERESSQSWEQRASVGRRICKCFGPTKQLISTLPHLPLELLTKLSANAVLYYAQLSAKDTCRMCYFLGPQERGVESTERLRRLRPLFAVLFFQP